MQYPWLPWAGKTAALPLTCMMANEPEQAHTPTHWVISKSQTDDQRVVCG